MIPTFLNNLVPFMLSKIKAVPQTEKLLFAGVLAALCDAYRTGDKLEYDMIMQQLEYPAEWKAALTDALWNDANPAK